MKHRITILAALVAGSLALAGCDRTPGVRTSGPGGGPGNQPESEQSPQPTATP